MSLMLTPSLYITYTPLYFVRSGYFHIINNRLRNAGSSGYSWPSSASSKLWNNSNIISAYYLDFWNDGVRTSNGPDARLYSRPLRYLASRGGGPTNVDRCTRRKPLAPVLAQNSPLTSNLLIRCSQATSHKKDTSSEVPFLTSLLRHRVQIPDKEDIIDNPHDRPDDHHPANYRHNRAHANHHINTQRHHHKRKH